MPRTTRETTTRLLRTRSVEVRGVDIFYREAGPASASTILLLRGFPSSSRMWEPLLTRLGDTTRFMVVAALSAA
ncbi:MAG TPA: hypothetical protein VME22_10020 [Solirubrobacteraceae bacterium]|nr:hypothetical protein [Solirubrobacteraceae bacterium]